jgi:transposase
VPKRLALEGVERSETGLVVRVRAKRTPQCPACAGSQVSYHSQYQRRLRDLPWQGQPVRIHLRVRGFRCRNRPCERKIFAERLPGLAAPKARETDRRGEVIRLIGYALGGLPGSRLLERLGMKARRDTVLRRVKQGPAPEAQAKVRVLGVDDWAWGKQQRHGTLLMDLEQRRVIDLLPVRSASSFAPWLRLHPGVEIIARDRCGLYAEGGREGAPSAVQINDRYHLMSNLSEAVEREIHQLQIAARSEGVQEANPKPSRKLHAHRRSAPAVPSGAIRALPGGSGAGASRSDPTRYRGEGWSGGGNRSALAARPRLS